MVFISFLLNTFFADVLGYEVKPAVGASTEDDDLPGMRRREVVAEVVGKDLCIYKHTLPKLTWIPQIMCWKRVTPF